LSAALSIPQQIALAKERLRRRYKAKGFIAYFQSFSNTYAPVATLRSLYSQAIECPQVVGIAIGTRPDCVPGEIIDLLEEFSQKTYLWVEYGLQSIHDPTLRRINRGHTASEFIQSVKKTRSRGIEVVVHVIQGLPGEGKREMLETARVLGELGVEGVKSHLLYVVKGTPLEEMFHMGEYCPLSQERYVEILCEFLALLPPNMVIHRLTGDPHFHELVAPKWALEKTAVLKAINLELERRDLWQGKWWHEGNLVEHEGLQRALFTWLDQLEDGRFILRLDKQRIAYIEVEDTPFIVQSIDFSCSKQLFT
jgi:radical SAM protein (TIGR01212 family)